jgi:hypothetical protein
MRSSQTLRRQIGRSAAGRLSLPLTILWNRGDATKGVPTPAEIGTPDRRRDGILTK